MRCGRAPARRVAVLTALKRDVSGVSGEALAHDLGISRAAVAKHVSGLRLAGYAIDAIPGRGYRLRSVPDTPLPLEVEPLLRSGSFPVVIGGGVTGSTNDDARSLAASGAEAGTVVLASEQTAGRGRLGRRWSSPAGGVYLSVVLRPEVALADAGALPLVVGLGVAQGLEREGVRAGLKWPNDVVSAGGGGAPRKLAGVLLESMVEGERLAWAVAGVGLNVRAGCCAEEGAVSVDELAARRVPLASAAASVLDGIAVSLQRFGSGGFPACRDDYEERCVLSGRAVTVRDIAGRVVAEGVASGIDERGRLQVESGAGRVAVPSGDVTLRR